MKKLICVLLAAVMLAALCACAGPGSGETVKVGLICIGDENDQGFTYNFVRATETASAQLKKKGINVEWIIKYNLIEGDPVAVANEELAEEGCAVIFNNSYGQEPAMLRVAPNYPNVQFVGCTNEGSWKDDLDNTHNAFAKIYEGRYVAGVAAGMKLQQMIDEGTITADQAVIGYVGAYSFAEVVSGYTAYYLGAKSVCPSVTMKVQFVGSWSDATLEANAAQALIDQGCVMISHHSNTIGSAIACEDARKSGLNVYHIGYNQDMMNVAPTASLTSCRIDWTPYIISAVEAVVEKEKIESNIKGKINGYDASGGFKEGWVKMFGVNTAAAAEGSKDLVADTIKDMSKGKTHVFKGDYTGVDPNDPNDTYDLNKEYIENEKSSAPTFHYVIKDIITVIE